MAHRYLSLVLSAVALLVVLAASNHLLSGLRVDLTENRIYTLSDGTRQMLGKIDETINLYYFYTPETGRSLPTIAVYAQRVQEMLQEMAAVADGKLQLHVVQPEAFSEQEDQAVVMGVTGVPLREGGDTLYFGLAGSNAVGDTEAITFFRPEREQLVEYDIARMIDQLNRTTKPAVGLMTPLEVRGGFDPKLMRQTPPWTAVEQLKRFFDVRDIPTSATSIPEGIDVLLLIHPAGLSEDTLYAIDQFVLGGGSLIAFVDPLARSLESPAVGQPEDAQPSSDLEPLLSAWGAKLRKGMVLADAGNALRIDAGPGKAPVYHYGMVGITADGMNQDEIMTRQLQSLNFGFAGILDPVEVEDMTFVPLVWSSDRAMPMPASRMAFLSDPGSLQQDFAATGERYTLAARIQGLAKSAMPQKQAEKGHIVKAAKPVNVVVVADSDMLSDQFWVQVQNFLGQKLLSQFASNGEFLLNATDFMMGGSDLIGIKPRAAFSRPFTRVEELKRAAERQFRAKEEDLVARLEEAERKLNALEVKDDGKGRIILSPEQEKALLGFQQDKLEIRKELRAVRHELDRSIERLGSILKFINIFLMPILLSIAALYFSRRRGNTPAPLESR